MIRTICGLVLGIATFAAILAAFELVMRQVAPANGAGAQLAIVAAAYFLAVAAGAIVAGVVSREMWPAWTIVLLAVASSVWTIVSVRQPLWMQIVDVVAPLLGGLAARAFLAKRIAAPAPAIDG
jgi:hypothetical protein